MNKSKMTPMRAIRAKCLDCSGWSAQEVRLCPAEHCPLHPYRSGHNPKRKGIGNKHIDERISSAESKAE